MSKLDNIIIECVNKALDQKEEKLGDYIDPTKQQIQRLILELIDSTDTTYASTREYAEILSKKVEEL